jgi:hypothetical protein
MGKLKDLPNWVTKAIKGLAAKRDVLGCSFSRNEVYTTKGTIQHATVHPEFAPPDCGPTVGNNSTGHRLPSSSSDWRER